MPIHRLVRRKKAPVSPFGGFKKRTITATEFLRTLVGLTPDFGDVYRIWVKHEVDPGFREELMLAVAQLNDCRYCTWGHHEWAHVLGVSDEELAHVEQVDPTGFDRRKWLALSFVRELVGERFKSVSPDLLKAMHEQFTPHEIHQIELIAKVMDVSNLGANTWDALLSRLRGKPAADTTLVDEVLLGGVFLVAAPAVLAYLSHASGRSFSEMVRSMINFTQHDDASQGQATAKP